MLFNHIHRIPILAIVSNYNLFFFVLCFHQSVEELTCLATWKDGNSRYLVGLVSHHHAVSNEERYRCFVYEKILSSSNDPTISHWYFRLNNNNNILINCFLFTIIAVDETTKDAEYKLAQSGDATCNGLDSAEVVIFINL